MEGSLASGVLPDLGPEPGLADHDCTLLVDLEPLCRLRQLFDSN